MRKNLSKERINWLQEKKLIVEDDDTLLKQIEMKYKRAFEKMLNEELYLYEIDNKLEQAQLLFAPSTITLKDKNTQIQSNYIRCLNQFYVEELEMNELEILKNYEDLSEQIMDIVRKTYKKVLTKRNSKTICYNPATPERIIKNGTLVFELSYGKNQHKVSDTEYLTLIRKQKELLNNIIQDLEKTVLNKWNIPCKVLIEKRV